MSSSECNDESLWGDNSHLSLSLSARLRTKFCASRTMAESTLGNVPKHLPNKETRRREQQSALRTDFQPLSIFKWIYNGVDHNKILLHLAPSRSDRKRPSITPRVTSGTINMSSLFKMTPDYLPPSKQPPLIPLYNLHIMPHLA